MTDVIPEVGLVDTEPTATQCWGPISEEMFAYITGDAPLGVEQLKEAENSFIAATEILGRATGYRVHGAGDAVDAFLLSGTPVRKLIPNYKPVTKVLGLTINRGSVPVDIAYDLTGSMVLLQNHMSGCRKTIRLEYSFGSTVTRGAWTAALFYARQLYMGSPYGDLDQCQLPERVTSITREGLTMTAIDSQTFLDKGLTGVIKVDEWLSAYVRQNIKAPAALYSPDSPPPVNVYVKCGGKNHD